MNLVPPAIAAAYQSDDAQKAADLGVMTCMECGCCSFSCPAHRYIVQTMRMAKGMVRRQAEQRKKEGPGA